MSNEEFVDLENDELTETVEDVVEDTVLESASETDVDLPEKFKGKGLKDVVASYEALEKEYGRRNNEIGELRRLTDQLLQMENAKRTAPAPVEVDASTLLDNPKEAIKAVLKDDPELSSLKEELKKIKVKDSKTAFESKHPDWQDVVNDNDFKSFTSERKFLRELYERADRNFDYEAATELLDLYKEIKKPIKEVAETKLDSSIKKAKRATGGESGTSGVSSKKLYRRAELVALKINNPAKYAAMNEEITKAYAEGRVR